MHNVCPHTLDTHTRHTRLQPYAILMGLKTCDIFVMHLCVHNILVTHLSMRDSSAMHLYACITKCHALFARKLTVTRSGL